MSYFLITLLFIVITTITGGFAVCDDDISLSFGCALFISVVIAILYWSFYGIIYLINNPF